MKVVITTLSMLMALSFYSVGLAQTVQKKGLTLEGAKKVIAAAVAEAKQQRTWWSHRCRRRRRQSYRSRAAGQYLCRRRQHFDWQGADRGLVQTAHEVLRRRDQQGADRYGHS